MKRALSITLLALLALAPSGASAWDSQCSVYSDPEAPVAELARVSSCEEAGVRAPLGRLRRAPAGDEAVGEHTSIFDDAARAAGLPAAALDTFVLDQFLAPEAAGHDAPLAFEATTRHLRRALSVGELASLPDFSYALWDWARANDTCPLIPGTGSYDDDGACHAFATHMGPVNASHFPPQSDDFYDHYHALALRRAEACAQNRSFVLMRGEATDARFSDLARECELEALALEAVAQHYLQDTFSAGHMWQRWGGSDVDAFEPMGASAELLARLCTAPTSAADCDRQLRGLLVALAAGLLHGTEPLTGVCDLMCCPGSRFGPAQFVGGPATVPSPALGDVHWGELDSLGPQSRLRDCVGASIAEVYDRLAPAGAEPILGPRDIGILRDVDPDGAECRAMRATNRSMAASVGVEELLHPDNCADATAFLSEALRMPAAEVCEFVTENPLASTVIAATVVATLRHLIAAALVVSGVDFSESAEMVSMSARWQVESMRVASTLAHAALDDPDGTSSAESPPPFLGVARNAEHRATPPASYADPELPWLSFPHLPPTTDDDRRAEVLARTFHRAHAAEWCPRTTEATLDALRANVESAAARGPDAQAAACTACVEIARRHVRLGCDPDSPDCTGGYDTAAEPFCHIFQPAAGEPAYIYAEGATPTLAAEAWCGDVCGGRVFALTDAGVRVLSGRPLALDATPAMPYGGGIPRDGAIGPGNRLYVTTASGTLVGFDYGDPSAPVQLDLNGAAEGLALSLGGELRGATVISAAGGEWLLAVDASSDRLHVLALPAPGSPSTEVVPCLALDVGGNATRVEGPWDVVVDRAGQTAFVSFRGSIGSPSDRIAMVDLREVFADYASSGTCRAPATVASTRYPLGAALGYGAMSLSPDGSRLAITARRSSTCLDRVYEVRANCSGSTCVPEYVPVDTQVGCDGVYVLDVAARTWSTYDGTRYSTRPLAYPYSVTWLDDRRVAVGSFQFPLDGWPAGVFDPAWSEMPNTGAVRLVDLGGDGFDTPAGGSHAATYNVAMPAVIAGDTVHYSRADGALYVGSNDGTITRIPVSDAALTPGAIDPFWEGDDGDPETILHNVGGTWFGGCTYACNRLAGRCPRPCRESSGDPVTSIALGSPVRALVR